MRSILLLSLFFLSGCAISRPQVQVEFRGNVETKPEYTVTISL